MPTAQDIYNTLVKDPDLEIGAGQTREEAAGAEAQHRARQFMNNVQALSLATQDDEPKSNLKALANHIKSIGKTMVGGTISIIQDILKKKMSQVEDDFEDPMQFFKVHPNYKNKIDGFGKEGGEFFDTLIKSGVSPVTLGPLVNALHDTKTKHPDFMKDENWVHSIINETFSNPEFGQGLGFTPDTISKLHESEEFTKAYPGALPEQPPFKEESYKSENKDFYGTNKKNHLNTPASVQKINDALKKTSWGKDMTVGLGGTGKIKINSSHASDVFNPFPNKSDGRIYNSFVNGENPTSEDDTIDSEALGSYSVADMMNAIIHLQGQPTEKDEQAAEAKQAEIDNDIEEDASAFKEATKKLKTVPITPDSIGKPHVAFGSWGREGASKFGAKKVAKHTAHSLGLMHGLVNEFGQFTPVGQALIDDMYDKGLLTTKDVQNAETHGVISGPGMEKIIDHHGLQNPTLNEELAKKIAGDNYGQNIADQSTFDKIAEQLTQQMPEGGAEPTSQDVIDDTSEAIDVPIEPTDMTPSEQIEQAESKIKEASHIYNTVHNGPNSTEMAKTEAKANLESTYTNVVDSVLTTDAASKVVQDTLDSQHHKEAFDFINDNASPKYQGTIIPDDVAQQLAEDDETSGVSPTPDTTPEPEQTQTTTPTKQPKTSSDTKKAKVMESLFGDDISSEEAQIYSDHLDDNPNELDSAYKQHVISEIVNKQKQKVKDATKAKVDKEKAATKEKEDAIKSENKAKLEEQKTQAKVAADELKQKKVDANVLPHDIPPIKTDKNDNPINKIGNAEATHKALELLTHKKLNGEHMSAAAKKKLEDNLMNAKEHGADFEKIAQDYNNLGDDFGSPEHMKQTLNEMKDLHTAHALHDDIISGEGEHAKTLEHAFNQGAANHYGDSAPSMTSQAYGAKKNAVYDGEHSHDVHALTHTSPFEKEQLKNYKEAKIDGDKKGMDKAKQALEESGFNMNHLEAHEDEIPKSGPPDPEVAAKKLAEGYAWHEETRHWILKDTLDDLHGGHGKGNASIVNGEQTDKAGAPFALDEHGNNSGSQFVLHGDKNLHAIGDGNKPKGVGAHYSKLTGNALKQNLGAALDKHNEKGVGVTKLKGFDSNSGKLAPTSPDGGISAAYQAGKKKGAKTSAKFTGKIGSALKNFKATYGKEGNYGKGWSQSDKTVNKSLDLFISKVINPHDDRMQIRELLERIEEEEGTKNVKKRV